jgi:hypothetical protein
VGCTGGTVGVQLGRENLVGGPEMKCFELVRGLRCSEACASIESSVPVLGFRSVCGIHAMRLGVNACPRVDAPSEVLERPITPSPCVELAKAQQ